MAKWKLHYSGPTEWEFEADDQFEAEQKAEEELVNGHIHCEEMDEDEDGELA